mgnify:CR=1 FL=1
MIYNNNNIAYTEAIMNTVVNVRQTKYCTDIEEILRSTGHASNYELLRELRKKYPTLSATTVHRATARLSERGQIASAPPEKNGSMRYDTNTLPHDHFVCQTCERIRDIDIAENVIPMVNSALGACKVTGRLVIYGSCENCIKKGDT